MGEAKAFNLVKRSTRSSRVLTIRLTIDLLPIKRFNVRRWADVIYHSRREMQLNSFPAILMPAINELKFITALFKRDWAQFNNFIYDSANCMAFGRQKLFSNVNRIVKRERNRGEESFFPWTDRRCSEAIRLIEKMQLLSGLSRQQADEEERKGGGGRRVRWASWLVYLSGLLVCGGIDISVPD